MGTFSAGRLSSRRLATWLLAPLAAAGIAGGAAAALAHNGHVPSVVDAQVASRMVPPTSAGGCITGILAMDPTGIMYCYIVGVNSPSDHPIAV